MSDPEITSFGKAFIKQEGARVGPTTPKALREFEVECALDAAYAAGVEAGKEMAKAGLAYRAQTIEAPLNDLAKLRERQQVKLEMAKAVAQTVAALSSIIDETGGIR